MRTNPSRLPWRSGTSIEVPVTQEHIDRGTPLCDFACPLAIAVADYFTKLLPGTHWATQVYDSRVSVSECDSGEDQYSYEHDGLAFIATFDMRETRHLAHPFTLTLTT